MTGTLEQRKMFSFPIWKKSRARILATAAEATRDGGVTIEDMCPIIEQQYGKKCSPDVALSLARSLLMDEEYLAVDEGNHKWTCTKKEIGRASCRERVLVQV